MPAKEGLRAEQERRPPSSGKGSAKRRHEQLVTAAKTGPSYLALQDLQLVAKDYQLDVGAQIVGGADDQSDQTAQHEIHESE
jgi:hypothetical protein